MEARICKLIVIEYKRITDHELDGDRLEWVVDTIKNSNEAYFCVELILTDDKFEVIIARELSDYIIRYLEYLMYKYAGSDLFYYMAAFKPNRIRWYDNG